MKKLEKRFIITYNAVIAGLLTLLGFASSCEREGSGGVVDMYGTPSAKFIVNGKVVSSESDLPVKNIRVVLPGDTATTDEEGNYMVNASAFPHDMSFNISFQDIDSTLNAEFENLDTVAVFKDPDFTNGDGNWYRGETSKELNVKLSPKK